jgi:DNA-binding CsgD family transcriptional regulator
MEAPLLLGEAGIRMGKWDYRGAVAKCREAQSLAAKTGDTEQAYWSAQMLGDICRRNRNARRAAEHHRAALQIVDRSPLGVFERAQAEAAIGMDLVMQGQDAEAEGALEETARTSRQWGLKGVLVPSLFYLGWLHGRTGREQDAARCVGEAMRVAAEHEHVHFFCQEAKVAIPIFALCDRFGNGTFLRTKVVPFLPARLQEYFLTLATGKTYPTDVGLGAPQRGHLMKAMARGTEVLSDGGCTDSAAARIDTLTDREHEILKAIAEGMPNKVIGAKLFISEKTVKTHVNHIFRKLGVTSRLQAALVFQSHQRALAAGSAGRNRPG